MKQPKSEVDPESELHRARVIALDVTFDRADSELNSVFPVEALWSLDMTETYNRDLAYIHDVGFCKYALGAAPGLLKILRAHHINQGMVVDVGCGSGIWAKALTRHL